MIIIAAALVQRGCANVGTSSLRVENPSKRQRHWGASAPAPCQGHDIMVWRRQAFDRNVRPPSNFGLAAQILDLKARAPAPFSKSANNKRRCTVRSARCNGHCFRRSTGEALICRSICAARPFSCEFGRRFGRSLRVPWQGMRISPSGLARQSRFARWQRPARRMSSRWQSPATVSCAMTVRSPAIAGAWRASALCWNGRQQNETALVAWFSCSLEKHNGASCCVSATRLRITRCIGHESIEERRNRRNVSH